MARSLVRSRNWDFDKIEQLYLDDADYKGIEFWYNDSKEQNDELRKLRRK